MLEAPVLDAQARVLSQTAPNVIPSRPAAGHRDFLDGVRAIAALWVIASHLWIIPFGMNAHDGWLGRLANWTLYSHFAVDIFIVLSGFCLILPVARAGALSGGAWQFFRRRARRILPPFYAALGLSVLVSLAMEALEHQALHVDRQALLANLLLVQDLFLKLNIFNGPFWSIAVEWRIYWVFPLLVWLLPRCGRRGVLLVSAFAGGAATLALARWQPEMFLACPWYLLLFALGLCAGSLSAERPRRGEKAWCEGIMLAGLGLAAMLISLHPRHQKRQRRLRNLDAAYRCCGRGRHGGRAAVGEPVSAPLSTAVETPAGIAWNLGVFHLPDPYAVPAAAERADNGAQTGGTRPAASCFAADADAAAGVWRGPAVLFDFRAAFFYAADSRRSSGRDACGGLAGRPNK